MLENSVANLEAENTLMPYHKVYENQKDWGNLSPEEKEETREANKIYSACQLLSN